MIPLRFHFALSISATSMLLLFLSAQACAAADDRPNIVLIMADDLGFSDLGCYGGEINTPHLDRLAQDGLRFSQFYNNAICTMTRASLLTGLYARRDDLKKFGDRPTIADVLRAAGYRTLMTGKWHLPGRPTERGFDRYAGLLSGCCNHFNPGAKRPGEAGPPGKKFAGDNQPFFVDGKVVRPYTPDANFYSTDRFTDDALEFLDESGDDDRPFFLYVAYTVPHYPLHAPPEDIARYRGKYLAGWDQLRQARYERLKELGLIEKNWPLSPRSPHAPAWNDVEDKPAWDLKMAVYAAMVDRMDQNIGRILAKIRQRGEDQNTLILFLSDNGASDEDRTSTPNVPPGPVESYRSVDLPWATLSNTPFQHFKRWNHEGGIATPLIAYWPKIITEGGRITDDVGHVIDIMATCIDIGAAQHPRSYKGREVSAPHGRSLLPVLKGEERQGETALFWNQRGLWRAVRQGQWKLVSPDHTIQYNPWRPDRKGRVVHQPPRDPDTLWELYDIKADRGELLNLADQHPERVRQMADMYRRWEMRCEALP